MVVAVVVIVSGVIAFKPHALLALAHDGFSVRKPFHLVNFSFACFRTPRAGRSKQEESCLFGCLYSSGIYLKW